jgi:hypothetical protein
MRQDNGDRRPYGEAAMVAVARERLAPHFHLLPEAWLEHCAGARLRIDLLAWPKQPDDFPFRLIGVEVKRPDLGSNGFTKFAQALKQCCDYAHSVIVDERCTRSRGLAPAAVFLYHGAVADEGASIFADPPAPMGMHPGAVRLAGKFNVGELVNHPYDGFRLEIGAAPLWSEHKGVTGAGARWPARRLIGNSRRRAA